MLSNTYDTDIHILSFLDISTVAYIKPVCKYIYDIICDMDDIKCTKLFNLTKSLMETNEFLESQYNNIIMVNDYNSHYDRRKYIAKYILKNHINFNKIKWLYGNNLKELSNCKDIFKYAVGYASLEDLKWIIEIKKMYGVEISGYYDNYCVEATKYNRFEILKWLTELNFNKIAGAYIGAIQHQNFDMLEYLLLNNYCANLDIMEAAVNSGNLNILKWIYNNKFPKSSNVCIMAIKNNNPDIIQWMFNNIFFETKKEPHTYSVNDSLYYAILNGNIEIAEKLLEYGHSMDIYHYRAAVINGSVHILNWMYDKGFHSYDSTSKKNNRLPNLDCGLYSCAIKNNNFHVLYWLIDRNFSKDTDVFSEAIKKRNFELLDWLVKCNFEKKFDVYNTAVKIGDITVLDWLVKNNFPKERNEIGGFFHMKVVGNSIPVYNMGDEIFEFRIEIFEWLIQNGFIINKYIFYDIVVQYNKTYSNHKRVELVKWMVNNKNMFYINGVNNYIYFIYAMNLENINLMKMMLHHNFSIPSNAIYIMLKKNNIEIVKWMIHNKFIFCDEAVNYIINNFHICMTQGFVDLVPKNKLYMLEPAYQYFIKTYNIKNIKWMIHKGIPINKKTVKYAIVHGNILIIKLIFKNSLSIFEKDYIRYKKIIYLANSLKY